jgi:hypothetical protein
MSTSGLLVNIQVAKARPMAVTANNIRFDIQNVHTKICLPLTSTSVPLPNQVMISGQSLHVHLPHNIISSYKHPRSLELTDADMLRLVRSNMIALLPDHISVTWKSMQVSLLIDNDHPFHFTATRLHLALASNRTTIELHEIEATTTDSLPLLVVGRIIVGIDATVQRNHCLDLKLTGDLQPITCRISETLEPYVSWAYTQIVTSNMSHDQSSRQSPLPLKCITLDVQVKLAQVSIRTISRSFPEHPAWLPISSDLELRLDEIRLSLFPPTTAGIRSHAELRLSRTSLYASSLVLALDDVRFFFEPITMSPVLPPVAAVEMEAEWLRVYYAPTVLHAVGAMFHLFLFIGQKPLKAFFATSARSLPFPSMDLPPKRTFAAIFGHAPLYRKVALHGVIKRIVVVFPITIGDLPTSIEHVAVDAFTIETSATSQQYRLHFHDIRVYPQTVKVPYLHVQDFCIEETPEMATVDIYGRDIVLDWNQNDVLLVFRIMHCVQDVTRATYLLLFQIFHSYTLYGIAPKDSMFAENKVNPPFSDTQTWLERQRQVPLLRSASGVKLHRFISECIVIKTPVDIEIHVAAFGGDDVPDLWSLREIAIQWQHQPEGSWTLFQVQRSSSSSCALSYCFPSRACVTGCTLLKSIHSAASR